MPRTPPCRGRTAPPAGRTPQPQKRWEAVPQPAADAYLLLPSQTALAIPPPPPFWSPGCPFEPTTTFPPSPALRPLRVISRSRLLPHSDFNYVINLVITTRCPSALGVWVYTSTRTNNSHFTSPKCHSSSLQPILALGGDPVYAGKSWRRSVWWSNFPNEVLTWCPPPAHLGLEPHGN